MNEQCSAEKSMRFLQLLTRTGEAACRSDRARLQHLKWSSDGGTAASHVY